MSEEVMEETGSELATEEQSKIEEAVGEKMSEIFRGGREDDEDEEDGDEGEAEEPGGEGTPNEDESADENTADPGTVDYDEATVEELRQAEREAAESGDYDKAKELRDLAAAREPTDEAVKEKGDEKSAIAPALLMAAKELGGWNDKDIKDFVAANPTLARITFQKIADNYNAMSMQYAQAARNGATPLTQTAPQQTASPSQQQQTATLEALYRDLNGFGEIAGSEMVERFIKPLKSEVLDPLKDVIEYVNQARAEHVRKEIYEGFDKVAANGFEDHYGKADSLTDAQRNNRQKVAAAADLIHAGAQWQKVPMGYAEAIRRAHLIVNAGHMETQARAKIVKEVKQRSTQITARPTNRVTKAPKLGDAAAAKVVEKFWEERD